jgi:alkylation response protein AidB-like acyl-CoA dehydrogenase
MQLTSAQVKLKERAAELSRGLVRQRGIEIDKSGEYPWDVVEALKNERFMGMTIPKELGGQGLSFLDPFSSLRKWQNPAR